MTPRIRSAVWALGLLFGMVTMGMAQEIGRVAFVTPAAQAQSADGTTRALQIGGPIFANDRLTTDAGGRLDVIFLDETSLSLGANTDLVMDRFVFDPNAAATSGEIVINLGQGVLRLIGGAATNARPAQVTTATGTIGIRGSSGIVSVDAGNVSAVFIAGEEMCITNTDGQAACTSRFGGYLTPDGYSGRVPTELLGALIALFEDEEALVDPDSIFERFAEEEVIIVTPEDFPVTPDEGTISTDGRTIPEDGGDGETDFFETGDPSAPPLDLFSTPGTTGGSMEFDPFAGLTNFDSCIYSIPEGPVLANPCLFLRDQLIFLEIPVNPANLTVILSQPLE